MMPNSFAFACAFVLYFFVCMICDVSVCVFACLRATTVHLHTHFILKLFCTCHCAYWHMYPNAFPQTCVCMLLICECFVSLNVAGDCKNTYMYTHTYKLTETHKFSHIYTYFWHASPNPNPMPEISENRRTPSPKLPAAPSQGVDSPLRVLSGNKVLPARRSRLDRENFVVKRRRLLKGWSKWPKLAIFGILGGFASKFCPKQVQPRAFLWLFSGGSQV